MIVRTEENAENEKCSSSAYVNCPAMKQHREEIPIQSHCPFLQESLVQYCSASSLTKFIPYSESLLTRCGSDSHQYCDVYLSLADPKSLRSPGASNDPAKEYFVEGIKVPPQLAFSANHMWLDRSDDGLCHVGVDAFLGRVFGQIERLNFVTTKGYNRPTLAFTVRGIDLQLVFPNSLLLTGINSSLRINPEKLNTDPYTHGWMFEGIEDKAQSNNKRSEVEAGLLRGKQALEWMRSELFRIGEFVRQHVQGQPVLMMTDGGELGSDIVHHLTREDISHLYNEFFSPYLNRSKL